MAELFDAPFPWPVPDEQVRLALEAAYRDGSWGKYHGLYCGLLSDRLCGQFARSFAAPCSSGTIAVELALRGCGIEAGDLVALGAYDFPGNFRAIEAIGARPLLVDVSPDDWCLDLNQLEAANSKPIKAVLASHLHGGLVDMPRLIEIARKRNWQVVEDACQCPGATIANRPAGSWGDASVLSFGGSKLLTAGRGGAVLIDDPAIHQRLKIYSERGNHAFPLSELQAAVLIPQLEQLDERNAIRRHRVGKMQEALQAVRDVLRPVTTRSTDQPAYYKVAWSLVEAEERPELRAAFLAELQAMCVPVDAGFRGFAYRSQRRCAKLGVLDASRRLSRSTVLLHHPILVAQEKSALQAAELLSRVARQLVA